MRNLIDRVLELAEIAVEKDEGDADAEQVAADRAAIAEIRKASYVTPTLRQGPIRAAQSDVAAIMAHLEQQPGVAMKFGPYPTEKVCRARVVLLRRLGCIVVPRRLSTGYYFTATHGN